MPRQKYKAETPLALFRRVNHLTQLEAARLVKCRQSTWNRLEHGQVVPRPELAGRLMALTNCLLYTSPSPRDGLLSRMPSSA